MSVYAPRVNGDSLVTASFLAGQLLDKAATQEAELRKAKQELTRKQEAERRMANEMRAPVSFVSLHAIEQMQS